jgi:hypothetical protein
MIESNEIKNKRWEDIITPELEWRFKTRTGSDRFKAVDLTDWLQEPLCKDTWDAVLNEARMTCAFLNDYGDHCEGLRIPTLNDIENAWNKAVVKIIWNIIKYNDPAYEPVNKAFAAFMRATPLEDCMPTELKREFYPLLAWAGEFNET